MDTKQTNKKSIEVNELDKVDNKILEDGKKFNELLEKNKDKPETPLRKRFKSYMACFYNNMGTYSEKLNQLKNNFAPKFWWNKFWKRMHISDTFIFGALPILLAFFSYVGKNVFDAEVIFFLALSPIAITINLGLVAINKFKKRKLKKQMKLEESQLKDLYQDKAFNQVREAAKLSPELMIEEEMGKEVEAYKATHTKEEFKEYYASLVNKYEQFLKDNGANTSDHTKAAFYEAWHYEREGDINIVSHEDRQAIAEVKNKILKKKSSFDDKLYKDNKLFKKAKKEEELSL